MKRFIISVKFYNFEVWPEVIYSKNVTEINIESEVTEEYNEMSGDDKLKL